ncbi:unnamed protein product [Coccothraustes coccothraustes]
MAADDGGRARPHSPSSAGADAERERQCAGVGGPARAEVTSEPGGAGPGRSGLAAVAARRTRHSPQHGRTAERGRVRYCSESVWGLPHCRRCRTDWMQSHGACSARPLLEQGGWS